MKLLKKYMHFLFLGSILSVALLSTGCEVDEEDPVDPKTLEEYKAEAEALFLSERAKARNTVVGYGEGNFRNESLYEEYRSDYLDALNTAIGMLGAADLSIADVMDANYLITSPGNSFNSEVFPNDRTGLHERIVYGDTLRVHTPVGTETGMAPQAAHDQFSAALSSAKGWRSSMTALDRQIAEATEELNVEIGEFENAIVK